LPVVARKRRDTGEGIFHVYTHAVWAAPALFRDDVDRLTFLRELARATAKIEWTCLAYCLMGTHYHLLLDVSEGVLPRGMHALNFRYACSFNSRHESKGHVQMARYGSRRIAGAEDLRRTYKYVARNPVKALLCRDPADWPWSSYRALLGLATPQPFVDPTKVVRCFGDPRDLAIAALRQYVDVP
jgi:REP element-mobilizing transposase RayT